MFTISVSIINNDSRSYDPPIEEVEITVPSLLDAATVLNTIRIEMDDLRQKYPEPEIEVNKLDQVQTLISDLGQDDQAALDAWMEQ